jgi:ketosteroid isomerase-like protein
MSDRIYPTAQDAENAFYEALERGDLDAMMAVWAEDEEIVCVHPGGERLTGQDQVRTSWAKILADGSRVRVHISHQVAISGMMIAVHSVQENFSVEGERGRQGTDLRPAPVVATNVYLRIGAGWRMIVHHASPAPGQAEPPRREGSPKILH